VISGSPPSPRDRGAVDVSIEMLFGMVAVIAVLLVMFEAVAYWHARNVFDDAAADGARIAAAYDGSCADGIAVARAAIARHAGGWADSVDVSCSDGPMVTITVRGSTPGVIGASLGFTAAVSETAPRER
jgi:TadE-like protein